MNEPGPILQPREWQVLELLRRGFADHQIAQVLGITPAEAGRHVSSIAAKLELTRDDIAAWRPHEPVAGPAQTAAAKPAGGPGSLALKIVIGTFAVIAAVAIAAIGISVITNDDRATAPIEDGNVGDGVSIQAPFIGDHWHAAYEVNICGEKQPNIPTFSGGVHTHADGFVHVHPQTPAEEGLGARLVKFFEYAGGSLSNDTLQMPGSSETYTTGELCPDGTAASLSVTVNGTPLQDVTQYTPLDGDNIVISFNP